MDKESAIQFIQANMAGSRPVPIDPELMAQIVGDVEETILAGLEDERESDE